MRHWAMLSLILCVPWSAHPVPQTQPVTLVLSYERSILRANVQNTATVLQQVLVNEFVQPAELFLRDEAGRTVVPEDSRPMMKANTTITRDSFVALKPGERFEFRKSGFVAENGLYRLAWGTRDFQHLKPGRYKLHAEWTSAVDHFVTPPSYKSTILQGVWKGHAVSNTLTIDLP